MLRSMLEGLAAPFSIDARPLMLSFAVCAGAALYFSLPEEPSLRLLMAICLAALIAWLGVRRWSPFDFLTTIFTVLFGVSLGAAAGGLRAHLVAAPVVHESSAPTMVEGWLEEVEPGRRGVRLLIRTHSVAGMAAGETPVYVRLTHRSRLEVSPGRFVRCWASLRPPPGPAMPGEYDFRRQAWFEQLGAVGYVQGRCRGGTLGAPDNLGSQAILWLGSMRRMLALEVQDAAGPRAGGFAAALIAGDRSFMRLEDEEALRNTGLAHVISISGLHLSIVGGLVFLLVRRTLGLIEPIALRVPVQKPAALAALAACFAYLIISGWEVPTQRAFIMIAIVFGAVLFDRAAISLRTFAIALLAVVLVQPEGVVTPGFQMSFAATGALIAAYEVWRNRREASDSRLGPIGFSWASIIVTSIVAGLATMPFALFHFDRASPIGFIANLVAMPIVSFLSAPAAALAFILAPFGLADVGLRLFGLSLELLLAVAHYFERFNHETGYSVHSMPATAMLLASMGLACAFATTGIARLITAFIPTAVALLLWQQAPSFVAHWSASGEFFYATAEGGIERIKLAKGQGLSPLRFSETPAGSCTQQACDRQTELGLLRIVPGESSEVCLFNTLLPHTQKGCDGEINPIFRRSWREVEAAHGVTVLNDHQSVRIDLMQPCGRRLWDDCKLDAQGR